ncbi:MAG: ligase-associated DNA damage response DEXH box helicase [Bacteroidota bacterium]
MKSSSPKSFNPALRWFRSLKWKPQQFQLETWEAYLEGSSGLVNAPTGSGKTYSLGLAIMLEELARKKEKNEKSGLRAIWITPIRALSTEIEQALNRASTALQLGWRIESRTGDTPLNQRQKQRRNIPQVLITTPESLHLLLASKGADELFSGLRCLVADEWHELVGSKRAVQLELALSKLRAIQPKLKVWGISATIGNMDEAMDVLLGDRKLYPDVKLIRSSIQKKLEVVSIIPDDVEQFPWAGHLGIKLLPKVLPIINSGKTVLIFTNTRSQCEMWYQRLLDAQPELSGIMAMHHGSISRELRQWVEESLNTGKLKVVVCTSSLDLGVDFRPVEIVIQVGSPKGVARFMQRAGRSGHAPGQVSRIYFLPTNALELIEAAALRQAINENTLESRLPYIRSFDVLVQYLITLAVGDGFYPEPVYNEVRTTFSFQSINREEWNWVLYFITQGGNSLGGYDEYKKVEIEEDGRYKVNDRRIALRHRLSIGTITSDSTLSIKYISGGYLGHIEEWFISRLKPGDVFWFAGRNLELVRIKDMTVQVRNSTGSKRGVVPSWMGGRMPLSSTLSGMLRHKLNDIMEGNVLEPELAAVKPIIDKQQSRSAVPGENQFLIEYTTTREGYHVFMYPFEGRFVHEGLAALVAYRISQIQPISFTIAYNDYGFELLSDTEVPLEEALSLDLFTTENLYNDIQASVNSIEMARRRFRDIAGIAGLTFKGYPGRQQKDRHLQASSQLFFGVFAEHEPDNLLLRQSFSEVMEFQLEETRMREALSRIGKQEIILKYVEKFTPFCFPLVVDRLREKLSSEKLEDRIKKMVLRLEK